MSFPSYEALTFANEPAPLLERLTAGVGQRLAAAADPRGEAVAVAAELRELGYALLLAGRPRDAEADADVVVFEVRRPPESARPGLRLTMCFSSRTAEATLVLPEESPVPIAVRQVELKPSEAEQLTGMLRGPQVDERALAQFLEGWRVSLRGAELVLRLDEVDINAWVSLLGIDLDQTARPVRLFARAEVGAPGHAGRLIAALREASGFLGLPPLAVQFDALRGDLEGRVKRVARATGGRLQRLECGESESSEGTVGLRARGLFSTRSGGTVEVLLVSERDRERAFASLARVAENHRVRLHEGVEIRAPLADSFPPLPTTAPPAQ